jgi:hypothetical protein
VYPGAVHTVYWSRVPLRRHLKLCKHTFVCSHCLDLKLSSDVTNFQLQVAGLVRWPRLCSIDHFGCDLYPVFFPMSGESWYYVPEFTPRYEFQPTTCVQHSMFFSQPSQCFSHCRRPLAPHISGL